MNKIFYNIFTNEFFPTTFDTTDGKFPAFNTFREEHPEHEEKTAYQLFNNRFGAVNFEIKCESMIA
jgi:hypothetical protein